MKMRTEDVGSDNAKGDKATIATNTLRTRMLPLDSCKLERICPLLGEHEDSSTI